MKKHTSRIARATYGLDFISEAAVKLLVNMNNEAMLVP